MPSSMSTPGIRKRGTTHRKGRLAPRNFDFPIRHLEVNLLGSCDTRLERQLCVHLTHPIKIVSTIWPKIFAVPSAANTQLTRFAKAHGGSSGACLCWCPPGRNRKLSKNGADIGSGTPSLLYRNSRCDQTCGAAVGPDFSISRRKVPSKSGCTSHQRSVWPSFSSHRFQRRTVLATA